MTETMMQELRESVQRLTELGILYRTALTVKDAQFTTEQAKHLAELGCVMRHAYFSSDEFVTMGWVSEYPTEGAEWERFWRDRLDFPPQWTVVLGAFGGMDE